MNTNTSVLDDMSDLELEKEVDDRSRGLVLTRPEEDFEIIIENYDDLNYETRKFFYLLSLPLMWILTYWVMFKKKVLRLKPKTNSFFVDGLSIPSRRIKEGAGSWKALDIICNYEFGKKVGVSGAVSDFWIGMINAQAVRNRKKLAKRELLKAIREYGEKGEVKILSVASGSVQALSEIIEMAIAEGIKVKAVFTDLDQTAVDNSNKLIEKHNLEEFCTAVKCAASSISKITNGEKFHIVEMIGFLDYRPHLKAIRLIEKLKTYLLDEGTLLTANIIPNPEMHFLEEVIDWRMIYRHPKEIGEIIVEGGFDVEKCKILVEPHNVHAVIIAKK